MFSKFVLWNKWTDWINRLSLKRLRIDCSRTNKNTGQFLVQPVEPHDSVICLYHMTLNYEFIFLWQAPRAELAQLGEVFDTIVEIFLFFDKNGDGKLNKKDMMRTMNETNPKERSPAHITKNRFSTLFSTSCQFFFCSMI